MKRITDAYIRLYRDTGQTTATIEWTSPEGHVSAATGPVHVMAELLDRARQEGVKVRGETW